jgi:predicted dehydrogenase
MKRVAIIGGETHIRQITELHGDCLEIVGSCMREDVRKASMPSIDVPNFSTPEELLTKTSPDIVAIANENDKKFAALTLALDAGCDAVVDKPLCINMDEQERLEAFLAAHPNRRVLNLLTLRGDSLWVGLRGQVVSGEVGVPAFAHIRMAVRLKRETRPPWFLDVRRSGGLFLDLLIHGLDQVEWLTGRRIVAVTATTGNLSDPSDVNLRDCAAAYCELDNGASAVVEGQRMLPDTQGQDYRALVVGAGGYAELSTVCNCLTVTNESGAGTLVGELPERKSVVRDWLAGGDLLPQEASLRANRLAILATQAAERHERLGVT